MKILTTRLDRAFSLTYDLIQNIASEDLSLKLSDLPSNTIGEQLWCMIGASFGQSGKECRGMYALFRGM